MERLSRITGEDLQTWAIEARLWAKTGQLPHYIPQLSQANPDALAVQISGLNGQMLTVGDRDFIFPLMSTIKPLLLLYLLMELGNDRVFDRVGKDPSDYPFYSLTQLQKDNGFPRNPMINSGAIVMADLLAGESPHSRCESLRVWLNTRGNCQLFLDESVLKSVFSTPNPRNLALVGELKARGYLDDAQLALETYNYICCLSGTVKDLASLGLLILRCPDPISRTVLDLMSTCGLYEASAEFAHRVGLPTKSGVSGVVLSILDTEGSIVCYSPPLNNQGNSIAGLFLLEKIARYLD